MFFSWLESGETGQWAPAVHSPTTVAWGPEDRYLFFAGQCGMHKLAVQQAGSLCVRRQEPYHKGHFNLIVEGKPENKKTPMEPAVPNRLAQLISATAVQPSGLLSELRRVRRRPFLQTQEMIREGK